MPRRAHLFARAAAMAAFVSTAAPSPAVAHWSASAGRSLFADRWLVCDGDLDVRCVGPVVAAGELARALRVGAIDPDRNNARIVDPAHDAAIFAAYFDVRDAIPSLRRMLVQPLPEGGKGTHAEIEVHGLRAEAAYALAALGDESSAPGIAKLVRSFETEGHGFLWRDTLEALTRLSPVHASAYARDFLARHELADMRRSLPGGSSHIEALAPILVANDRNALPILRALTAGEDATAEGSPRIPLADAHNWCRLTAARIVLGDEALRADVRKAFARSYGGTMVATCDNELLSAYGSEPEDAAILLRHLGRDDLGFDAGMSLVAYDRTIALVAALDRRERRSGKSAAIGKARKLLRDGLRERSSFPHVADPAHRNFGTHFVALHTAALAALGDAAARDRLHAMIVDSTDESGVADLAAIQALRLELPGAIDDAARRLALDVAFHNDERSGIFADLRVRLLDALRSRAPDDPRWTVALVDADGDARERAIHAVSRATPKNTCDAVIGAAADATPRAIDDGFLVLTTLPDGCRAELETVARDVRQPAKVRGMAFEALAVLGSALPTQLADDAVSQTGMDVHVDRARAIASARRGKQR